MTGIKVENLESESTSELRQIITVVSEEATAAITAFEDTNHHYWREKNRV